MYAPDAYLAHQRRLPVYAAFLLCLEVGWRGGEGLNLGPQYAQLLREPLLVIRMVKGARRR